MLPASRRGLVLRRSDTDAAYATGGAIHPGLERQPVQRRGYPPVHRERVRAVGPEVQLERYREGAFLPCSVLGPPAHQSRAQSASASPSTTPARC